MIKKSIFLFVFSITFSICFGQLVPYRVGDKWGYSDTSGNIVIKPQYQQADFFDRNVAFVQLDSLYYLINTNAEILSESFIHHGLFKNGLCPVMPKLGRAYYINAAGKIFFNKVFSGAENFSEGLAVVSMKNKLGIINTDGDWVREPDFDSSSIYFKSGFLLAKEKGKFIYIDKLGKELVLPENLKPAGIFSEGLAAVYLESKIIENNTSVTKMNLQFIDTSGNVVISKFMNDTTDYADYINYEREFTDGKAIINSPNQLAYDRYYIDTRGRFSEAYSFAQHLGDSLFLGVIGYYLPSVRIYDRDFYVMGDFSMALTSIGVFGDGLLAVQNKAGYWGFCDSSTRMIIPFIYENANPFINGFAIIVKQGKYGVIDRRGKEFFREN